MITERQILLNFCNQSVIILLTDLHFYFIDKICSKHLKLFSTDLAVWDILPGSQIIKNFVKRLQQMSLAEQEI